MVEKKEGVKLIFADPDPDKKIVSMLELEGFVLVATERGIYRLSANSSFSKDERDTAIRLQVEDKGIKGEA